MLLRLDQSAPCRRKIVYICDWLPPDYGAVGQYSALFARELAAAGNEVVLVGLSSRSPEQSCERFGKGSLATLKLHASAYDKSHFLTRLMWTAKTNMRLVARAWGHLRSANEIIFTGSPPLLIHWLGPANLFLKKTLIYRITDFHPECLMVARKRVPLALSLLYRATLFWRRRVHEFEVLGQDQAARLEEIGIPSERIRFKPDMAPVPIVRDAPPLPRPEGHAGKTLLLYSGNWGVAHDYRTFIEAYRIHCRDGSGRVLLWLNAVGAAVDQVEAELKQLGLPYLRSYPVSLEKLGRLLVTPDAHLITLSDPFVGFVLPSKVHGAVASERPVLFIGSERSDVHRLCATKMRASYRRVSVGDTAACAAALEAVADEVAAGRSSRHEPQEIELRALAGD